MIRRPPRSTPLYSSAASDVYKRQAQWRHDTLRPGAVALDAQRGPAVTEDAQAAEAPRAVDAGILERAPEHDFDPTFDRVQQVCELLDAIERRVEVVLGRTLEYPGVDRPQRFGGLGVLGHRRAPLCVERDGSTSESVMTPLCFTGAAVLRRPGSAPAGR